MALKKIFEQNPTSSFIDRKSSLFEPPSTGTLRIKVAYGLGTYVETFHIHSIYKKKGCCELLVSLSMLLVHFLVDIRECDPITQVGVEHIFYYSHCIYKLFKKSLAIKI